MQKREDLICIILCGGKGSRMNSDKTHKVCFEIDGVPAVNRLIGNLKSVGINRFITVVGSMAGQVIECIGSEFDGITFAFQKSLHGTGDAVRKGMDIIKEMNITGPVMVVMGDKQIETDVINEAIDKYFATNSDALIVTQPKEFNMSGGRIVLDSVGDIRGICESVDVKRARIDKKFIRLGNDLFDPDTIENTPYVNAATYIFKREALEYAFKLLHSDNAQNEVYITDAINVLANTVEGDRKVYNVQMVTISEKEKIMSFNTVEELMEIQSFLQRKNSSHFTNISFDMMKPVDEWIQLLTLMPKSMDKMLNEIYGDDTELISERRSVYLDTLEYFKKRYGNKRVIIVRAPGRVNLMGRHVEHRGGCVNVISINKEIIAVVCPRNDDKICISNIDNEFEDRLFSISEHLSSIDLSDWLSYIESEDTKRMVTDSKGDWINYVKAAVLKLQYTFKDRKLLGMDMVFNGNIPKAAGLSSSSAMVVVTAEAAVTLNDLDVTPQKFVDLCGEGEWFVGSRGGAGDHAAMKFGSRGYIAQLGFFPFGFMATIKFPEKCRLVVANSHIKAQKTTNAKDLFNQRITSYEIGFMLIKEKFPQYEHLLNYLRDINTENLVLPPSKIYEMLLQIPETIKPEKIFFELPKKYHDKLKIILSSHNRPEYYLIRSVILYGIAECQRSRMCRKLLEDGDFKTFGKLMEISHNGDRVAYFQDDIEAEYNGSVSDEYLKGLISDLRSEVPEKVLNAQIEMQPGGYACSTSEIDYMIDITKTVPGVIGAQLSGAGLGGCIMILVEKEGVSALVSALNEKYYSLRGLESGMTVCSPVMGSMVWSCK